MNSGRWQPLVMLVVLAGCGGRGTVRDGAASGGEMSQGGSGPGGAEGSTGGVSGGGRGGAGGDASVTSQTMGADLPREAGVAGDVQQVPPCDVWFLARAVAESTGTIGSCFETPDGGRVHVTVVLDGEGRVIDNSRLQDSDKQKWLDSLADQRWPCLANQTISFTCRSS